MLPKKGRVTKELFQDVMKNGKILGSSFFVLRYIPQNPPKYAFVVPKTLVKQAIIRNKLRRVGYNIVRQIPKTPLVMGIFFYKKLAKTVSFEELKNDINSLLSKTKL